jgi:hypothetical protein
MSRLPTSRGFYTVPNHLTINILTLLKHPFLLEINDTSVFTISHFVGKTVLVCSHPYRTAATYPNSSISASPRTGCVFPSVSK